MMYGEIVDNENQELSLIQFFIKQNNLQDKIFCVVPEREKLKKSVEIRNYFENRANNLLSLLNNEKAKELLSHTLTENNKADVKDKVHILLDCINNFRVIVNGENSNIGIINVRKITTVA